MAKSWERVVRGVFVKISIVTATFNAEETLAQCLESFAAQRHADREQWVIDGASTDGTLGIVAAHAGPLSHVVSEPDGGIYDALNKGIARATGDVVGFLHADDLFAAPDTLERVAAAFEDPTVDAVYGDLTYVDRADPNRVIRYWQSGPFEPSQFRQGWMPPHPTFYARRSVYERLGGFDTRYRISADYDCLARFLFVARLRAVHVPHVLVKMRVGGVSNRSLRTMARKSAEDLEIMRRHGLGGVGTLLQKNLSKVGQFVKRQRSASA